MKYATTLALLLSAATLLGCAAPRYQTFYSYQPPTDTAGAACVQACEQTRSRCLEDCKSAYTACVRHLEPEAAARYQHALEQYAGALHRYRSELDRYHLSLALGWASPSGWYGGGVYDPAWAYGAYSRHYPPPLPPAAPSYSDELGQLSAQQCLRDCGCQPDYDSCFLDCGGRKLPAQRCIANCPAAAESSAN